MLWGTGISDAIFSHALNAVSVVYLNLTGISTNGHMCKAGHPRQRNVQQDPSHL